MTQATLLERYKSKLTSLRAIREMDEWNPQKDRIILEEIDAVFEAMTDEEQGQARAVTSLGWPFWSARTELGDS